MSAMPSRLLGRGLHGGKHTDVDKPHASFIRANGFYLPKRVRREDSQWFGVNGVHVHCR